MVDINEFLSPEIKSNCKTEVINGKLIPNVLEKGELGVALEWFLTDNKTGLVIPGSHVVKKSESYVQQFLQLFFVGLAALISPNVISVKDTGGTSRSAWLASPHFRCDAAAGDATYGIVVGTGATAPTITDYVMQTPIAHGVGAGQLQYSTMTFGALAANTTTAQITLTRNFANASGGSITVNEIGLYCQFYDGSTRYALIIRDVTGGIAVPNGQTLTVNYRPQANV